MSTSGHMHCKTNSVYVHVYSVKQWYLASSSCIECVFWNFIGVGSGEELALPQKTELYKLIS